jgi:hypothetical protein
MASYKGNQVNSEPDKQAYMHKALQWLEPKRTTTEVRNRFESLKSNQTMQCVWSAKTLNRKYDIDHSMPFARWPNNDLWNLVPSNSKVNNEKRDRLPTERKLVDARERMLHWWNMAWADDSDLGGELTCSRRFFAEANIALPGLSIDNTSIDDLFEALLLQRSRLKEMQQLKEW